MTQKKLSLAAMAVCLAFGAAVPATAAQYGEISRSNKESVQVTQEVALTALIARYADPREGKYMATSIWQNGERTVQEFMAGQRNWRQPFGFVYSPDFIWNIQGRENVVINGAYDSIGNKKMRYGHGGIEDTATLENIITFFAYQGNNQGNVHNIKIMQSTWFGMAFAAASVNFAARISEEISNQLEGITFLNTNDAYVAVGRVLNDIGDNRLNQEFLTILNYALLDSYIPNMLKMASSDEAIYSMLITFTTGNGSVIRIGKDGWEYINGTLYFSPEKGIIAGVPEKISISSGRDSTFTKKGQGIK